MQVLWMQAEQSCQAGTIADLAALGGVASTCLRFFLPSAATSVQPSAHADPQGIVMNMAPTSHLS